ncbi:MAG: hypothetical protein EOP70_00525 [Variovorax sp.]|nr:MAG: hypothetical protein EOP70_00525 [Variovorax sp.]
MTSFVHVDQPTAHPGVARAEAVVDHFRTAGSRFDGARGLAALMLAAVVAALLVVADKLVSTLNEGGLLAAWLVMWAVAFVALAFFAETARSVAQRTVGAFKAYGERRTLARADEQFLAYAKYDARVMQELAAATTRHQAVDFVAPVTARLQAQALVAQRTADVQVPTLYEAMRRVNMGKYY